MRTLSTVLIKSGSFTGSFSGSNIESTIISSSQGFFGLDVVVNGILKAFDVVYAYAGVVGNITGSLSGSKIVVSQLTASNLSINTLSINELTASSISSSNANFTYVTASAITSPTASFNYLSINNTGSAPLNMTAAGIPGEIRFDNNFIYIYTNEKWIRTPIAQWI